MPIINVYGIPEAYAAQARTKLLELRQALKIAASSVVGLKLKPEDIWVHFAAELAPEKPGKKILLYIDLFQKSERSAVLLEAMSTLCVEAVGGFFRTAAIECYPRYLVGVVAGADGEDIEVNGLPACGICESVMRPSEDQTTRHCTNCGHTERHKVTHH